MIVINKFTFTLISLLFILPGIAQEKGDIGLIVTSAVNSKVAIEYRKPFKEKFNFKIGATYGEWGNYFAFNNSEIISVSDSAIIERDFNKYIHQAGLRFGVERQLGNSMFTIGADITTDYRRDRSAHRNRTTVLMDNGSWGQGAITTNFASFTDPTNSKITRHYLVTGARLNCNMDIPIGKAFLLNLSVAGIFGVPIYMGATDIQDPANEFIGLPPSVFNLDMNLGIGLRYIIGSRKKVKP